MDSNDIQSDKLKSYLIEIEALQKEYETTLQTYQEAINNYIVSLQDTDNGNADKFVSLRGRTWWGTSGLKEMSIDTEEECQNMCLNDKECSGATFNPVKHYCWMRKGESSITTGKDDDYALIRQSKQSMIVMQTLNDKLIDLNNKINDKLTNMEPLVEKQNEERSTIQVKLDNSYKQLLEQKMEMDRQLNEYNAIESDETNTSLYVTQQNTIYRFLILIICLIFLFFLKKMVLSIIVLLLFSYTLRSPTGFAMWFILLVITIYINK